MNNEILFKDLENELKKYPEHKNLLLGNGINLSIPRLGESFDYASIISKQEIQDITKDLESLQSINNEGFDLEKIIGIIDKSKKDIENKFKENFVKKHQSYQEFKQYVEKLADFFNRHKFLNLFTLNYDLLLYWTILHYNRNYIQSDIEYIDGFWYGTLRDESEWTAISTRRKRTSTPNVFYLHGTIFIFCGQHNKPIKIRKPKFYKDFKAESDLRKYIADHIEEHNFPLLILEGNSQSKKERLENDLRYKQYGEFCKNHLQKIQDLLLIFGCSFKQDQYILNLIQSNEKLDRAYITFTDPEIKNEMESSIHNPGFKNKIIWVKINKNPANDTIWSMDSD